jgi:hypothetical protein
VDEVKLVCARFLEDKLDVSNCLGIMDFAESHGCTELKAAAAECAKRNFFEVGTKPHFLSTQTDTCCHS